MYSMKFARPISRHFTASFTTAKLPDPAPNHRLRIPHDHYIRELHAHYIRTLQHTNPKPMSQIVKSYALTSICKAHFAFNEIHDPTLPIWNHMIRGFAQSEGPGDALHLFDKMRELGFRGDNITSIFVCKACARVPDGLYGKRVHVHVLKLGFGSYLYVCNALVHMYGFCGDLGASRRVFDEMEERDLVSWNSLICAYSRCARYEEVLGLFDLMRAENVKADAITLVKVVLSCSYLGEWNLLDSVAEYIEDNQVEIDVYLGNTLIDVYGRRGSIALAWGIFGRMTKRNIVSWNAMLVGAAKSGDLVAAKELFNEMPERDVISWTSMITAYAQAKQHDDAIRLFQDMMVDNIKPDHITVASVLSACAHTGRLDVGKAIHEYIHKNNVKSDTYVENALIDMYCKCGSIEKALTIFHEMKVKDSVSWTSVICGLALNGDSYHAFELFSQMLREGINPNHGTFLGVLLACVHTGLVDKGLELFHSMQKDYGLVQEMRHYGCVVDLFCRAGSIRKAYEFMIQMPMFPDAVVWRILLSACNVHGDLVLAKIASDKLLELDPANGGNYALSSNLYAGADRWDEAIKMRELMMDKDDVLKPLGWSSIENESWS